MYHACRMSASPEDRARLLPHGQAARGGMFLCVLLFIPTLLLADVIYLKNGRKITGQVTHQDDKQITYAVDGGEVSISTSMVDHVEKSDAPASTLAPGAPRPSRDVPLPLTAPLDASPEEGSGVVHDGAVDEAYLTHLADEAMLHRTPDNLHQLKQGFQAAAVFLTRKGDAEGAIIKYREALKYLPDDPALELALGYLLWKQDHYLETVDLLLPAADQHPRAPDFHALLGSAYYGMDNLQQAIAEWNKALAMTDNKSLREAVARAQRELDASGDYSELRDDHFLLRYDGHQNETLSGQILSSLDGSFQDLALDLDYSPTEAIVVILYSNQAFRDITQTPSWVGAVNDGKIRLPVSGLTQVTPELARVLKHELTHSFVRQITQGRCPMWFNEGLAQLEEGGSTAGRGSQLARAMAAGQIPPYSSLEGSFMGLSADQAALAYSKSLAGLEYLRDTFGMGEVRQMLKDMATSDFGTILQDELRMNYASFEDEVANYVEKKYGS